MWKPDIHLQVALVASPQCRKVFGDKLYFVGRFDIAEGPPEHQSDTSVVFRAVDVFIEDSSMQHVALKLMKHESMFEGEKDKRLKFKLDSEFVVPVIGSSSDYDAEEWQSYISKHLPKYKGYKVSHVS